METIEGDKPPEAEDNSEKIERVSSNIHTYTDLYRCAKLLF